MEAPRGPDRGRTARTPRVHSAYTEFAQQRVHGPLPTRKARPERARGSAPKAPKPSHA